MTARFRVSADGFLNVRDSRRVRTPGYFERSVDATPEAPALAFLLSHAFPGHRRVTRSLTESDRRLIRLAQWADSVNERMTLLDPVWRRVTAPVPPPRDPAVPSLIQIVTWGDVWAYPLHLDREVTRVMPHGGMPFPDLRLEGPRMDLKSG